MVCTKCGMELLEGAEFCHKCGTRVSKGVGLDIDQEATSIEGDVTGVVAAGEATARGLDANVKQTAKEVKPGGTMTGAVLGTDGSRVHVGGTEHHGDVVQGGKRTIDTGGGTYIEGGVQTGGGDFVGRDKTVMSGDFRGANVNVKAKLENVTQTIGQIPSAAPSAKDELKALIAQLTEALQQAPEGKAEEAEAVADYAQALVDEAATDKPNKTKIRITGEGLKMAAQNLAAVMPTVIGIATQIVGAVLKLTG